MTETDETERAFKVVEIKLLELNIKPGAALAIIVPDGWTPRQIGMFQEYANQRLEKLGLNFKLICFPHNVELVAINPHEGFGGKESQ